MGVFIFWSVLNDINIEVKTISKRLHISEVNKKLETNNKIIPRPTMSHIFSLLLKNCDPNHDANCTLSDVDDVLKIYDSDNANIIKVMKDNVKTFNLTEVKHFLDGNILLWNLYWIDKYQFSIHVRIKENSKYFYFVFGEYNELNNTNRQKIIYDFVMKYLS